MDIVNNVNSTSVSTELSGLSSSVNVQSLNSANNDISSNSLSIAISDTPRSDFSIQLGNFIDNISSNQQILHQLDQQSSILTQMETLNTQALEAPDKADGVEASLTELMEKYNTHSNNLTQDLQVSNEDTESLIYFDGIIGAKPIDNAKLAKAIEDQQTFNQSATEKFTKQFESYKQKAKETINYEQAQSSNKAPFKQIDFGKDVSDFSAASINSIIGSVTLSQANAIPAHSPQLLAY